MLAPTRGNTGFRKSWRQNMLLYSPCSLADGLLIADSSYCTSTLLSGFICFTNERLLCPICTLWTLGEAPGIPPAYYKNKMLFILFAPPRSLCCTWGRLTPATCISPGPHWQLSVWVQPMTGMRKQEERCQDICSPPSPHREASPPCYPLFGYSLGW